MAGFAAALEVTLVYVQASAIFCRMAKPKPDSADVQAAALNVPERVLLFCVASKTEWVRAGITGATVTTMTVKGLVDRDAAGEFTLTKQGRAVLAALLMEQDE